MNQNKYMKKIVIIGAGVAGINAATTLVDGGYPGELITIIDKGNNPYNRKPEEVMEGMLGAGGWSDGKLTYHTAIGGQLSKYCGEDKAYDLMDKVIGNFTKFHPKPDEIMKSDPVAEPDFIKPYFGLRLFPVYHIGTDYLHEIGKNWYFYLEQRGVGFHWQTEIVSIDFEAKDVFGKWVDENGEHFDSHDYDILIFGAGKSGIDFSQKLINEYQLKTEPKSSQIGVRFEAPQKYFQKLIDISYDFKLYQKPSDNVSIRTFCTNNNAAYVAVEETYGNISYNGHAKKGEQYRNDITNFGIIMEIKGIENPFEWARNIVGEFESYDFDTFRPLGEGLYYSPNNYRKSSNTSEGNPIKTQELPSDNVLGRLKHALGEYSIPLLNFIQDLQKVFPEMGDDWGMYIPEVKYLSDEPLVDYTNLALVDYPEVHFVGDSLSARGITVSGAQGIYVAESILNEHS